MRTIVTLIVATLFQNIIAQEKELLIIGTMHEVPSIVSHSYIPGLTMLAVYHAGLYNRGIIEDNTIASQKEIIERDKNLIDYLQAHIGFLEDYIKEIKSTKTKK